MRWWRIATHPSVVKAGGIWTIFKQVRLAYRLLRDERVPVVAKLVLPAALVYLASPIDLIPDLIPLLGQVDDIGLLILSLVAFIRLCPRHLVDEHEAELDGQPAEPRSRQRARPDEPVDVRYEWVEGRARR